VPLIAQSFAALVTLVCVLCVWTAAEIGLAWRTAGAPLGGRSRSGELFIAASTVAALVAAVLASTALPSTMIRPSGAAYVIGLALVVVGVLIRALAVHELGAYYTLDLGTQADQALQTAGLYRWVRHPGYTGTALALLGVGFALGNWIAVLAVLIVAPALCVRIRNEERMLLVAFGKAYADYCSITRWRLVPRLL
jgi:protein-S-isoprenylcysteine O-methyltransferase Ste14